MSLVLSIVLALYYHFYLSSIIVSIAVGMSISAVRRAQVSDIMRFISMIVLFGSVGFAILHILMFVAIFCQNSMAC